MYRAIADDLRRRIESGELPPGSRLPTEIELQDHYSASRNTVRDAVKWLISRGLVETRPGQGTFVTDVIVPFVTTLTGDPHTGADEEGMTYSQEVRLRHPEVSAPRVEIQEADDMIVSELRLDADRTVIRRSQLRFIDGTPWSMQASYYPMRFVERGATQLIQAANIEHGTVAYLRETLGIKQAGYRDRIIVRVPGEEETHFFRLPEDGRVGVIETCRTAYDEDGVPMRLTISVYPADRNQLAIYVGEVPEIVADPADHRRPAE
jgi:GntR family transcriptional regulator